MSSLTLVGAGPVAFLFAALAQRCGLDTRLWARPAPDRSWNGSLPYQLTAGNPKFSDLAGNFQVNLATTELASLPEHSDEILLATPVDGYAAAARALLAARPGYAAARWILPSASLGSHARLPEVAEVVSLSSFWAAAKGKAPEFVVRGRKQRVYAGSKGSPGSLPRLLAAAGVELVELDSPLAAESRNITTYVHPSLFISPLALSSVLRLEPASTSMYKLFPEGPITRDTCEAMAELAREVNGVLARLGVPELNLLRFLNDDNYPVRPESVPRHAIENFPDLSPTDQAFWLYVRYASLLIDPMSEPDPVTGRYHEFSAVPFPCTRAVGDDRAELPRIPLEDYRTLLVYASLAEQLSAPRERLNQLCSDFEGAVAAFEATSKCRTQLKVEADRAEACELARRLLAEHGPVTTA